MKTPSTSRAPSGAGSSRRNKHILALSLLLAGIMVVAGITLFLPTKNGVIRIEINDPSIQVTIDNGNVIITQKDSKQPITLTPGKHTLQIKQGDLTFQTDSFTLHTGDKLLLRVERLPGKIQVVAGDKVLGSHPLKKPAGPRRPLAEEWIRRIAKLPPVGQAATVKAELLKRNPGFKGQIGWKTQDGKLTDWTIALGRLHDLSPLLALEHLKRLEYGALEPRADAVVLRDIKSLEVINGRSAATYRLAFPKNKPPQGDGMTPEWIKQVRALPVERRLAVVLAKMQDLNPNFDGRFSQRVVGGTVQDLSFDSTAVTDIAPLQVFEKLEVLGMLSRNYSVPNVWTGWLSDLSPLKGMKLTDFRCTSTRVMDLSPLKGMPLTYFGCEGSQVSDLSPLTGMRLTRLVCGNTPVSDLSPLKGCR